MVKLNFHLPPTSPPSCDWGGGGGVGGGGGPGICWDANSRPFLMKQQWPSGTSVPTPLAVRKGLFSCKFLAPAPGALLAWLTVWALPNKL